MRKPGRLPLILILIIASTVLTACPPLRHSIYVRNLSTDTARIIFIYKSPRDTISTNTISVRATDEIIPIKRKTIRQLNRMFAASVDRGTVSLIVPPTSTVYVSDILSSFYMFADKILVLEHGGRSDTMTANYPYKQLKGFRRKFDPSYNYFYRTIVYYDIR